MRDCAIALSLLCAMAAVGLASSRSHHLLSIRHEAERLADGVVKRQERRIRRHAMALGSNNQEAIVEAIRFFAGIGEWEMVAVALSYPSSDIVNEAAKRLKGCGDRNVAPALVTALKRTNLMVSGGLEAKSYRRRNMQALWEALESLVHTRIKAIDPASEDSVRSALQMAEIRIRLWERESQTKKDKPTTTNGAQSKPK